MSVTVLMYATRPGHSRSVASFRRFGIEPVILGLGERFTHQEKICIYYRWCVEHPGETVMALDAYDTCCVRAFSEDLSTDGVLFSAEANCWPEQSRAAEYPQTETRYRYLNSGAWLGNTSAFAAVCEQNGLLSGVTNSDQRAYTSAFLGGAAIRLDHGCEVFHSRYAAQDDCEIADGIYWVKSTGTAPLVVHGNGRSGIESVWEAYGV